MADCDKRVVVIYCCGLLVRAKMLLQFLLIGPSSFQVVFVEMSDIKKKNGYRSGGFQGAIAAIL